MTRTEADNLLAPLIADELDASTKADLLSYLATDPDLAAKLADMRAAHTLLQQSAASLTSGPEPRLRFSATRRSQLLTESTRKPPNLRYALFYPTPARLRYVAAAAVILAAISLLGVIFPPLGVARRTARQMQSNTQLRGIHQGLVTAAQGRDGHYPTELGELVEGNYITPEYLISPTDDKQVPPNFNQLPPEERRRWARENSSYAFIAPGQKETLDTDRIVAFEKPAEGKKGISVAYDDNHVVYLPTDQARQLIEQQTGHSLEALTTMSERGWTTPAEAPDARQSERFVLADREGRSTGTASSDAITSNVVNEIRAQLKRDVVQSDKLVYAIPPGPESNDSPTHYIDGRISQEAPPTPASRPADDIWLGDTLALPKAQISQADTPRSGAPQTPTNVITPEPADWSGGVTFNDSHAAFDHSWERSSSSDEAIKDGHFFGIAGGPSGQWADARNTEAATVVEGGDLGRSSLRATVSVPDRGNVVSGGQRLAEDRFGEVSSGELRPLMAEQNSIASVDQDHASHENRPGRDRTEQVQQLLHRAVELRREQKYEQAIDLTNQALFIDPTNIAAQAMKELAEDSKLIVDYRNSEFSKSPEHRKGMVQKADALTPYSEILTYPKEWPKVSATQLADQDRIGDDTEINRIVGLRLREPVPINFDASRLADAIDYLRNTTGVNFFVNWPALEAAGITKDRPVTLQLTDVPAEQALQLVLKQASGVRPADPVEYNLIDGIVIISTRQNLQPAQQANRPQTPPEPEPVVVKPPPLTPVNPWTLAEQDAQSTFAIDVDTASYDITRRYIAQGFLPPLHTVRMEEFVNAFDYNYSTGCSEPRMFAVHAEAGRSPFGPTGQDVVLLKVGVRGKVIGRDQLKPAHLTFVVDTSGSMDRPDRLPLVKRALQLLLDQLAPADRVSLVTYGTQPSLLLEAAPGSDKARITQVVDALQCQGSTNLSSGVEVGCEIAARHFTAGAVNRVILCSDGVANVGPDVAADMLQRVESFRGQGIGVTTVGFGAGTYNDRMLEQLANQGDGRYLYVGSDADAQRVFVTDMAATLPTIARNVKIQVDFDPSAVRRYRLIGYENRDVADADFRNDAVKGGEVGSGKTATALYELELNPGSDAALGRVFVRYQDAQTNQFEEVNVPLTSDIIRPRSPQDSPYFHLAACAAELAELLRESEHATSGGGNLSGVSSVLQQVCNVLPRNQQARELLELAQKAQSLPRATQ